MKILDRLFKKGKSKPSVEAHIVAEKKAVEAKVIMEDIKKKLNQTATAIEGEAKRNNAEMTKKAKELRDVAKYLAIITGGKEIS